MIDYKELKLKAGLEIHQQLSTKKLFCNCPSLVKDKTPDIIIKRRLRATAGETGLIDIAAKHEMLKDKIFVYETYFDSNCLVELDEEPPEKLNPEALKIAIEIALLLNAKPVDEIQIMRKTVVDGSNTSGFQRTSLIARNGFITTKEGKVGIQTICLEEDAARKIKEDEKTITYRLDRLGIPLVEIATSPDIYSPQQAREVASYLGMVLRSTNKVLRGIGTIRQDINLSIKNGARVEIKGVQDLNSIPKVMELEVQRQLSLLKENKKSNEEVRKANLDNTTSFLRPMPGPARMYPETDIPPIKITKDMLNIKLPKLIIDKISAIEEKYNLSYELAQLVIKENLNLDEYIKKFKNIEPRFIAQTLILTPKDIQTRYNIKIKEKDLEEVLNYLNKKQISKEAIPDLLCEIAQGKKIDLSKFKSISEEELKQEIKKLIELKKDLTLSAYMGLLMQEYKGKIEAKKIMEILKKEIR